MENNTQSNMESAIDETPKAGNGLAIAALVLSIIGALGSFILIGLPLLLIGFVLGVIVLVTKKPGRGMAIASVVIGLLVGIGALVAGFFVAKELGPVMGEMQNGASEIEALIEQYPELEERFEDPAFEAELQKRITKRTEAVVLEMQSSGDGFDMSKLGELMSTVMDEVIAELTLEAESLPTAE